MRTARNASFSRRAAKRFARARDREAVSAAVVDLARNVYARHPAIRRLAGYAALLQLVTGFVALYCCEAVLRRKPSHLRLACAGAAALATLWLGEVLRLVLVFATLGSELHWYGLRAPPTPSEDGPGAYVSEGRLRAAGRPEPPPRLAGAAPARRLRGPRGLARARGDDAGRFDLALIITS